MKLDLQNSWDANKAVFQKDLEVFDSSSTKTKLEKSLKRIGYLCWTVNYLSLIVAHQQTKHALIVGPVIAYDLVWEFGKTFVWSQDHDALVAWLCGIGWLGLDLMVAYKFWYTGDGSRWDSDRTTQRQLFIFCLALYSFISFVALKERPALARIWRHMSLTISNFIQMGYVQYLQSGVNYSYPRVVLLSTAIGNFAYIYSVRKSYEGWNYPLVHPVRFLLFMSQIVTNLAVCFYVVYVALSI